MNRGRPHYAIVSDEMMLNSRYINDNWTMPFISERERFRRISEFMPDIDDRYWVSDHGRVYDGYRNITLNPFIATSNGYWHVSLHRKSGYFVEHNQHSRIVTIHKLVAMAFVGIPEVFDGYKTQVNHINSVRWYNYYQNLEWTTAKENTRHAFTYGNRGVGENANRVIYTEAQIRQLCELLQSGIYDTRTICKIMFNDEPKEKYKTLIYNVRNRLFWTEISKDYDFLPSPPKVHVVTDEQVHKICEYFQSNPEEVPGSQKGSGRRAAMYAGIELTEENQKQVLATVNNIRRHHCYKDISSQYQF